MTFVDRLDELVDGIVWSSPSTFEQTNTHHGYRRNKEHLPRWVHDEMGPTDTMWLSWIEPGGFIVPHRDAGPYHRRVQICVRPSGHMWDPERGWFEVVRGERFDVRHWGPHAVKVGDVPRVHLVADLAEWAGVDSAPFALFGWDTVDSPPP